MARHDDDEDRPRKRRPREEDEDDEDDRPRKRRPREEDEDDEDRPKKRRPRDEDEEDEDDERPSRRRARDERDDDDDRPRKKKKKKIQKELPPSIITAAAVSIIWGSVGLVYGCYNVYSLIRLWSLFRNIAPGFGLRPVLPGQGYLLTMSVVAGGSMLLAAALAGGGVLLLMRIRFGRYFVLGVPIVLVVLDVVGLIISLVMLGGDFIGSFLFGALVGATLNMAVCINNFTQLQKPEAIQALK